MPLWLRHQRSEGTTGGSTDTSEAAERSATRVGEALAPVSVMR